ncbi:MAG: Na+:H+ antiporter, NhaA family [Actinomycetota bacterium]|nr:Na+:H+ antiporter, NhaA family [Actinomycetota bacterium]
MASLQDPDEGSLDLPGAGARLSTAVRDFLDTEVAGGFFLLTAAAVALVWASFAFGSYDSIWTGHLPWHPSRIGLPANARALINEGLMTLFFFVVGLEIKRELVSGELRDRRAAALPVLAAVGGMALPAAIYLLMTRGAAGHGWGIPMATDIAFALGALTLFGRGLPQGLRVLLLTLAVADDIGTLIVITLFYGSDIRWPFLISAVVLLAGTGYLAHNRRGPAALYILLGAALWWLTLQSGVPPTIAGVALGLLVPAGVSIVERVEHLLHPWTSFLILPLFALANAGLPIVLARIGTTATSEVSVAVVVARIAGKLAGISLGAWIAVRLGVGSLPEGVAWSHVVALGCVASIGFTIPLFVATLAFAPAFLVDEAKMGILLTTAFGFVIGGLALRVAARSAPA